MTKKKTAPLALAGTEANTDKKGRWKVENIWTKKLGKQFTPVSSYFLANYHKLKYPITPTELAVIVHLLRFKWDEAMPFPSMTTLAKCIGRSDQAIRTAARSLEDKKYLVRYMERGKPNHFDLNPLFEALEELYDQNIAEEKANRRKKRASHQA